MLNPLRKTVGTVNTGLVRILGHQDGCSQRTFCSLWREEENTVEKNILYKLHIVLLNEDQLNKLATYWRVRQGAMLHMECRRALQISLHYDDDHPGKELLNGPQGRVVCTFSVAALKDLLNMNQNIECKTQNLEKQQHIRMSEKNLDNQNDQDHKEIPTVQFHRSTYLLLFV
ncbi:hypothetical protein CHS0354_014728 [Potamilus streckersoni]|uniref:Uncharacterized protein n=1 Tax=Potamilus streckersoni TaxID=2493646 RepID=A0AAE0SPT6_9BIVA|nr:hypothetical protein CHS0354_014728 [Potamilus streckersoni]